MAKRTGEFTLSIIGNEMNQKTCLFLIILMLLLIIGCKNSPTNIQSNNSQQNNEKFTIITPVVEKPLCNQPYFEYMKGDCCLDQNDNKICDKDEQSKEEVKEADVSDKDKLKELATKLSRIEEMGEYRKIYDLLTEERKNHINKEKFIELYPIIYYGENTLIIEDEIVSKQINPNPISSMSFNEMEIKGDEGYVYYDIVYINGYKEKSPSFYFKKEKDEWKVDAYSYIIYASCYETTECYEKDPRLKIACEKSCPETKKIPLKKESYFSCSKNLCNCLCASDGQKMSYQIEPDAKYLR